MVKKYYSQNGQSLMDICLQLYGSPDLMNKLLSDNNISVRDKLPAPNTVFLYDTDYVTDLQLLNKGLTYSTGIPWEWDDDALLYIQVVNNTGYSLSKTERSGINVFVKTLKNNNLWKRVGDKAIHPMAGNTAASHKFNLLDPRDADSAFRLTYTGSPTHNANGITGVSNSYANTYCDIITLDKNNCSCGVLIKTHNGHGFQMSAYNGSGSQGFSIAANYDGTTYWSQNMDFGNDVFVDASGVGFYMTNVLNATYPNKQRLYKNGSLLRNFSRTPATLTSSCNVAYLNDLGNAHSFFNPTWSPDTISFGSIMAGMTDSQALIFYSALADLMTSFGR